MYPWLTDKQISDMQVREDILFRRYLNGKMNQEEYVKRAKALANEYAKPTPPAPPTAADWLKTTRPEIVSRTADGAYGEHLKTRTPTPAPQGIPIEGFGDYGIPLAPGYKRPHPTTPTYWLPTTPGQGVTVPQGGVGPTSAPGTEYPLLSKRHIPGFFGDGSLRDWLGQDWLARMQQLLDNLPAPFKNWLSNYPRLPQSTIPTPKDKYPVPGRPPAPGEPGYQNPFAWRRKNNSWW